MKNLEEFIRDVVDFPKEGIVYKDITPLLADFGAMEEAIEQMAKPFVDKGVELVTGVESRGFIFGSLLARKLSCGFVPIRKPGKLPSKTVSQSYSLEYGTDTIEMHADAIGKGQKVLMADDLLATGGTMGAACDLVRSVGGDIVGATFLIELDFLNGKEKIPGVDIHSIIHVSGE